MFIIQYSAMVGMSICYNFQTYEKFFGGTEFQNRFKKRRKHLLNLGRLEKDCFLSQTFLPRSLQGFNARVNWEGRDGLLYYHQLHRKICNKKGKGL